jgi:hypothetical protein
VRRRCPLRELLQNRSNLPTTASEVGCCSHLCSQNASNFFKHVRERGEDYGRCSLAPTGAFVTKRCISRLLLHPFPVPECIHEHIATIRYITRHLPAFLFRAARCRQSNIRAPHQPPHFFFTGARRPRRTPSLLPLRPLPTNQALIRTNRARPVHTLGNTPPRRLRSTSPPLYPITHTTHTSRVLISHS